MHLTNSLKLHCLYDKVTYSFDLQTVLLIMRCKLNFDCLCNDQPLMSHFEASSLFECDNFKAAVIVVLKKKTVATVFYTLSCDCEFPSTNVNLSAVMFVYFLFNYVIFVMTFTCTSNHSITSIIMISYYGM